MGMMRRKMTATQTKYTITCIITKPKTGRKTFNRQKDFELTDIN